MTLQERINEAIALLDTRASEDLPAATRDIRDYMENRQAEMREVAALLREVRSD